MTDIIHLQNSNALLLPELDAFVQEAFEHGAKPVPKERMKAKFYQSIGADGLAAFLARDNGLWWGLAWVDVASWQDENTAVVLHFYSTGGKDIREALVEAVVTFAKDHNAERLFTWDGNHKPGAFTRLFRSAGSAKEVMRAYEFDLSQAKY